MASTLGVLENSLIEAFFVSSFELPSALLSGRGWTPLSGSGVLSVPEFPLSPIRVANVAKTLHDNPSCFQSVQNAEAFGSIPVAMRQVTTARIIPSELESTRRVAVALQFKCELEDVAFQSCCDFGEIRERKFLSILE